MRSRVKTLAFWVAACGLVLAAAEVVAHGASLVVYGKVLSPRRVRESMREVAFPPPQDHADPGTIRGGDEVLHPYFGYTYNPVKPHVSSYGFIDDKEPVLPGGQELHVAVLGGSFASLLCIYSHKTIEDRLAVYGRPVRVFNLALGGYKQPQQLLILSYLLSLGARFDVVINVDGFNEVTLPLLENIPNGVFPFYPRQWQARLLNVREPSVALALGRLDTVREGQRDLARLFLKSPLSRLASGCAVWVFLNRTLQHQAHSLEVRLNRLEAGGRPSVTGPPFRLKDEEAIFALLADHWARCSSLMADLCRSRGIAYFHFLQPNQWVPNSKPMGEKERQIAFGTNKDWQPCVVRGYPLLQERGRELARHLSFHDLTMIFADVQEVLYSDDCCHLNGRGYELVAQAVCDSIVADLGPRAFSP